MRFSPLSLIALIFNESCCVRNKRKETDTEASEYEYKDDAFVELVQGYLLKGEWIDMSQPRQCSYNQHHDNKEKNITIGEPIPPQKTPDGDGDGDGDGASFVPMSVEMRGITLRQLRAIDANASRRCVEEAWLDWKGQPVTPETVNIYDINKHVILPFTKASQKSLVETLPSTAGTQPGRIYISHTWGNPFKDTITCIEQMVEDFKWNRDDDDDTRGGGMTEDTPLWICAFAHNQRFVAAELNATNLIESSFVKAMNICSFRTLTILDINCIYFTRVWCMIDIFMTLRKKGLWAIYTAYKYPLPSLRVNRSAIGIVLGGAPGEAADDTYIREESFPPDLIARSFQVKVAETQATVEADRVNILNFLSGTQNTRSIEAVPPSAHDAYNQLEDAVRGAFAASVPALKAALATGDDKQWKDMLVSLSKGIQADTFKLDFRAFHNPSLSSICAHELVSHIPPTYTGLLFTNATGETAIGMIGGMIEWLAKAKNVNELICFDCRVGDGEEGRRLGSQLANELTESRCTETIEHFYMTNTDLIVPGNISQWVTALKQMKSLKILYFHGVQISEDDEKTLSDATHEFAVTYFKKG